ncbi:MAG: TIGR01212 family radical SAM protein [Bacteroidales bacterium]|nr:TIGR01212 family radical SAM protein [Bacteroidales bacterium]
MIYPWGNTRRINAYATHLKNTFGSRIQKVAIDAGFTCPNRDGTLGTGGCTYCNNNAFNPSYCLAEKPVKQQILEGIEFHEKRYKSASRYMAYFQAYSNTYADVEKLKKIYNEALEFDQIVGLVIGTRPDCIDDKKLKYFKKLAERYYIIIEYGVESVNNSTLERINRGHTYEQAVEAIHKTSELGLKTGAHFIFGLPGESRQEILDSADIISDLPLDNVKFHQLQIIKDTVMEKEYQNFPERFILFSFEEYIKFVVKFIERLNPAFFIERVAGEAPPGFNKGITWKIRYDQILNQVEQHMEQQNTWQGKYFKSTKL